MQQGAGQTVVLVGPAVAFGVDGRPVTLWSFVAGGAGRLLAASVSCRPLQVRQTNRWLVVEQARIYHNCVVVRCKGRRRLLLFRSGPGPSPDLPSPISNMDFE